MRLIHVQTVLPVEDVEKLKKTTSEVSTKEALAKAIYHYLECAYRDENMHKVKLEKALDSRKQKPAATINRASAGPKGLAQSQMELGGIHASRSEWHQSLRCYRTALNIFRQLGDKQGELTVLSKMNNIPLIAAKKA